MTKSVRDPDSPHDGLKQSQAPVTELMLKLYVFVLLWNGQYKLKLSFDSERTLSPKFLITDLIWDGVYVE